MNGMEGNLRDMLDTAAGEPPRWISLDSIRRRAIQRRITQASVATIAVLAVGLGATLSAYAARGGPATGGAKVPAGPPKYYIVNVSRPHDRVVTEVRARATGKVTSIVHDPLSKFGCSRELAAAGTRTFFLDCQVWRKLPGSNKTTIRETRIYRFEVTNSGRATTPVLLKGGTLKGFFGENLTASADGSRVAIEVFRPNPDGNIYTNSVMTGIVVINTVTGKKVLWRTAPYVPGEIGYTDASDLSLTGNGSELVILGSLCPHTRYLSNCSPSDPREVRAFGPTDRGGSLRGGQVLLRLSAFKKPRTSLPDALITPDGTALNVVTVTCPRGGACTMTVERIGLTSTTGKAPAVLYQVRDNASRNGPYLQNFTSDPTGRFLIIDANTATTKVPVNGWINHGRLVPLAPNDGFDLGVTVW